LRFALGRGDGVLGGAAGEDLAEADLADHPLAQLAAAQDLGFRLDHLVDVGHRAAGGVAGPGLVDIFLAQADEQAGAGGVGLLHRGGEGQAQQEDDQEHAQHQPALAPQQGDEIGRRIAGTRRPVATRRRVVRHAAPGARR
jgi:hypothetical protein